MTTTPCTVTVTAIEQVAATIREYTLAPTHGFLSTFSPGSHIVVDIPGVEKTYKNAYSLLSDPQDASCYRIAVRLQDVSRGGSQAMHQSVQVGQTLTISPPANLFAPQWQAKKHILIAGGVGITPFMSYLPEFIRRQVDFELHYLYRGQTTGAYRADLAKNLGERYFAYDADGGNRCRLASILANRPLGTHFYLCGPDQLIQEAQTLATASGIPASAVHFEAFTAPQPGQPFEVKVASTGQVVAVGPEESMLEALEASAIEIPNLCRGGVCGQCVCTVVEGELEHRDHYLSEQEKSLGKLVMPCVSRAKSKRLVIGI